MKFKYCFSGINLPSLQMCIQHLTIPSDRKKSEFESQLKEEICIKSILWPSVSVSCSLYIQSICIRWVLLYFVIPHGGRVPHMRGRVPTACATSTAATYVRARIALQQKDAITTTFSFVPCCHLGNCHISMYLFSFFRTVLYVKIYAICIKWSEAFHLKHPVRFLKFF